MQNVDQENKLYTVLEDHIPSSIIKTKNLTGGWKYGYDKAHDVVVISQTGMIGEIIEIEGLKIALPAVPLEVYQRSNKKKDQYWEREDTPQELSSIQSIFQWNEKPDAFKAKWFWYIDREFDRREYGFWFMNNGIPTYVSGSHYMYLQWSSIDVGYPQFREANRVLYLYWEACKADDRCFGMIYLKIRRSGFSFMTSSEIVNVGTITRDARIGILSKTGADAKQMFTGKVVLINMKLPFFFKPVMDGMDRPKTEIAYRVPASKITKKNMYNAIIEEDGLNTTVDWRNTEDNSYDGEKLKLLAHDESGKWIKPNNILNNWRVTKTCLRLGRRIIGKCMMGSTSNALNKGGGNFKSLYDDSDPRKRNANQQTKSGLYRLFIPMEWNMEGFIDIYGMPVLRSPEEPVMGVDGELIDRGAIDYWEAEVDSLKSDPDALNEYYRQFPRTTSHAFRDESKESIFNLTKIYQQIDYNDEMIKGGHLTRGSFSWRDGIRFSSVIFSPDPRGRFLVSWVPQKAHQNNVIIRGGKKYPGNEHIGSFGCDSYDISGVVSGSGSNGALHGLTKFHMEDAPTNSFFLEYISRPPTAEVFFEDVLMAIHFYGMPVLVENNKPRLLYFLKNNGYRAFAMNRPDKIASKLSVAEREIGGIPNSSEDVKQAHASAIEMYIEKYVGVDMTGDYREQGEMGEMPFNRTLSDWARFDINNRTKYDASISSGLAVMACNKHIFTPEVKQSKIRVKFARYDNAGSISSIMK